MFQINTYFFILGPGGLSAPDVKLLTPFSASVKWESPARANGPITRYEVQFPDPKVELEEFDVLEYNMTGLIPFTNYKVGDLL